MLIAIVPRINGIPLKRGASATAAASPVRAVPDTKLMSLASLLLRIKTGFWREHTGRQTNKAPRQWARRRQKNQSISGSLFRAANEKGQYTSGGVNCNLYG